MREKADLKKIVTHEICLVVSLLLPDPYLIIE